LTSTKYAVILSIKLWKRIIKIKKLLRRDEEKEMKTTFNDRFAENDYVELRNDLKRIRFILHQNPELSSQEYNTTKMLIKELKALGLKILDLNLKTGVCALLEGGKPGVTVALRADIDALPVQEETGRKDASIVKNVMHACGHDVHMSALLGAAMILAPQKEHIPGNVIFIFQPAEETIYGAEQIVDSGLFEQMDIKAVFGFHVWPNLKLGEIGLRAGAIMASKDSFEIVVKGKGGHGSEPHNAKNPIIAGSALVMAIQSIVSQRLPVHNQGVVSICAVNSGFSDNVIPEDYTLLGSIRTFSEETRKTILASIEEISISTAKAYDCQAKVSFLPSAAAVVNHQELYQIMHESAEVLFGDDCCVALDPVSISEDFSLYSSKAPICFALFGVSSSDEKVFPLHNSRFYPSNDTLVPAAAFFANTAVNFLEKNKK
jgi:amidohydrolase